MDRKALLEKLKTHKKKVIATVAGGIVLGVGSALVVKFTRGGDSHAPAAGHAKTGKHGDKPGAHTAENDKHGAKTGHEGDKATEGHGDKHADAEHGEESSAQSEAHESETHETAEAAPAHPSTKSGPAKLFTAIGNAIDNIQDRVASLSKADEENERLRIENANLRLRVEAIQFDCRARDAASRTREWEFKLSEETGSKVGRTLASINYKPPVHLLPSQLYTLGVSYFKAREDEKATVILTFLTGLEENETYKSAKNFLMTGIGWYRMDHYDLADHYFDKVLKTAESPETQGYQAQARLWKALVSHRTNQRVRAQEWLRDLIDHHPQSVEAAWVNSKEAHRSYGDDDDDETTSSE